MPNLFQSLNLDDKVDFFVKCQKLMINYHPNSSFVIKESSLDQSIDVFVNNIQKYQGFFFYNENICVLWNHIIISDPQNIKQAIIDNAYKAPSAQYNAVSIDFAVFRKISDCIDFIKQNDEPEIKFVLFIKDGKPKIYKKDDLIKGII